MSTDRCKKHLRRDCSTCRPDTTARRSSADDNALLDPLSPLHQATYGGAYYGSSSSDSSSSSSSSSSDSGSSSSSYDSGSSSSSSDSGSY